MGRRDLRVRVDRWLVPQRRFESCSKAMSSTMLAAIWLTIPFSIVMSHFNATMRAAPSVEVDGAWAAGDGIGGGTAPECAGGASTGVGGGDE
ncbi:hypothetical protein CDL15_Pgr017553 [Punica granatum]|uniref:Uncharacterized protein n=1 Tax=Punica granatum TaxID=22663 RepID=A0A218W5E5_PUNGR|nr:hypothetical protein CDL15_Pgr017553 [Punica granatum]